MFLRYLFYAFLIYLAYRLVFDLIIPVYKTTRQVKRQFQEMSARMNRSEGHSHTGNFENNQSASAEMSEEKYSSNPNTFTQKQTTGDYIDFEDVK